MPKRAFKAERAPTTESLDKENEDIEVEENLPIAVGEVFDPESDLKEVQEAPKKEKREKLKEYKEKLAYQKEGLAHFQVEVLDTIMKNPDVTIEELFEVSKKYNSRYGLTFRQTRSAYMALEAYTEKHQAIKEITEEYPDGVELFKAMFNRDPLGKIELIKSPMALYFRIHNPEDYAFVYSGAYLPEIDQKMREDMAERSASTGGARLNRGFADKKFNKLKGLILIENARGEEFGIKEKAIFAHEEQHVINSFLKDEMTRYDYFKNVETATTEEEQARILRRYFIYLREHHEARAKHEILSYFKQGFGSQNIKAELMKLKEKGGLYDYISERKQGIIDFAIRRLGEDKRELIEDIAEQVFVKEYRKLIEDGVNVFLQLRSEFTHDYSRKEVMAILHHEPLSQWSKLLKRLPIKGEIEMPKTKQERHENRD